MREKTITPRTYVVIYATLVVATCLTVGMSFLPLPDTHFVSWHTLFGLTIAFVKATLVLLFFMHVIHATRLTWITIAASLYALGILIVLTLGDYLARPWLLY
jgi:cytochrome c oxidase subunit 4